MNINPIHFSLIFFHGTGIWIQGQMLARQAVYHLSHSVSPILFIFVAFVVLILYAKSCVRDQMWIACNYLRHVFVKWIKCELGDWNHCDFKKIWSVPSPNPDSTFPKEIIVWEAKCYKDMVLTIESVSIASSCTLFST
jgi:hypothetical protein